MAAQFLVSARKYRPLTFDTVVGQEAITTTLKNAIRNQQLAHAYLFCGPRGVGKTTCARILAKTINCENPTADIEACGTCNTCQSFQNNTSFNVFELDAASNNSVDDIRELVSQVRFAPQHGRYKIYIIDEVHMLSAAAFNAFLKTLEEPPPYAIFILATTEKHKIIPTILSRCQVFDFKRITTADVTAHLQSIASKEGLEAEEEALHLIALKSEGAMRDALSMLDRISSFSNGHLSYQNALEHLNMLDATFYFQFADAVLAKDVSSVMLSFDEMLAKGFEGITFLEGLAAHFRNVLFCKDQRMAQLLDVTPAHRKIFFEKAQITPSSFLLSALHELNESMLSYKNTNNKRLHTEMCLLRLSFLSDAIDAVDGIYPSAEKKTKVHSLAETAIVAESDPLNKNNAEEKTQKIESSQKLSNPALPNPQSNTATVEDRSIIPEPLPKNSSDKKESAVIEAVQKAPVQNPSPSPFSKDVKPGQAARFNKDLLQKIEQESNMQALQKEQQEQKIFDQSWVDETFEAFKEDVQKAGNKNVFLAILKDVKPIAAEEDTLRLSCGIELAETFLRTEKDYLLDFFNRRLQRNIGLEIFYTPEAIDEKYMKKVLTKHEMLQEMIRKNPLLQELQERLKLNID